MNDDELQAAWRAGELTAIGCDVAPCGHDWGACMCDQCECEACKRHEDWP